MSISYVGAASPGTTSITIPAHQVGDLILIAAQRQSAAAVSVPAAGGTVPEWTVVDQVTASAFGWVVASARATVTNTTSGTWTGASSMMCVVLRAGAGLVPQIVTPISKRNDETFQSIFVWPGFTATKKNSTSLGVLFGLYSMNNGSFSNNAAWRSPTFGPPRSVDHASVTFATMAVHVSTANLTADFAAFSSSNIGPTTFKQRSLSFEVVEASPVTPMVMIV